MKPFELKLGDCLEVLRGMPDNSVDSIVTDPPYGLGKEPDALKMLTDWIETGHHDVKGRGFMGKEWDAFVPQPQVWHECLRVLKPGGHLLAFAGTRTQDLMALGIRLAGFEIRDMVAWVYGCLSDDTEVLTTDGWELYHTAKGKALLIYDVQKDIYQWETPDRWNEYRVESDTAYHIHSDHTDQIVSRGHRCLVERGGMLTFISADELAGVESMPSLSDDFCGIPKGQTGILQSSVQRILSGTGMEEMGEDWRNQGELETTPEREQRGEEPLVEGGSDLLQTERKICEPSDQVCQVSHGVFIDGEEGRVCDATQIGRCDGGGAASGTDRVCPPHQPRCDRQPIGEPNVVCQQFGSQMLRTRTSYRTDVATVAPIEYSGTIFCPTVSTGAFVARRKGKIFVTGNSGFPKSLDVSKAIDKQGGGDEMPENDRKAFAAELKQKREACGVSRRDLASWFPQYSEVTKNWERLDAGFRVPSEPDYQILVDRLGVSESWRIRVRLEDKRRLISADLRDRRCDKTVIGLGHSGKEWESTTEAAKQWDGWGTALKPALEPITLARKPLEGTVAGNVLKWHTGALNIDGCRVGYEEDCRLLKGGSYGGNRQGSAGESIFGTGGGEVTYVKPPTGRWPANLIHDGSDEVLAGFPDSKGQLAASRADGAPMNNEIYGAMKHGSIPMQPRGDSGSAARFFYAAKCSKKDRNEGCEHLPEHQEGLQLPRGKCKECGTWKNAGEAQCKCGGEWELTSNPPPKSNNNHPTVKPTDLMRYLCRLITPPGGVILDPYMGSGSTGKAAVAEDFKFIGIERDPDYFKIAEARITAAWDTFIDNYL